MATPPGAGGEVPQAGYYPDPSIPGYIRYWNGGAWVPGTSRPAPQEGELPPAAPASAMPAGPALAPNPSPAPAVSSPAPVPAVEETGPVFLDEEPAAEPAPGPEPASAWQADVSRQTGFGGDRDQKVSWGAPEAEPAAGGPSMAQDPRMAAARTAEPQPKPSGPQARLGGMPVTPAPAADPTGGALPGVRQTKPEAQAPVPEGTMTIRALPPQGASGHQQGARSDRSAEAPRDVAGPQGPQALRSPQTGGAPLPHVPGQPQPQAQPQPHVQPQPQAPAQAAQPGTGTGPAPVTTGAGGGAPSWPQQVHQLAQPAAAAAPAAPRQAEQEQPVLPWKPPVEDPFLQAARAQAAARPAGLGKRLAARLVDTLVLGALVGGVSFPFVTTALDHIDAKIEAAKQSGVTVQVWLLDGTTSLNFGIVLAALLVLGVLYEALPTAKWGRTLGKKLCGLQVRDIEAHEPPTFGAALRRWLVYSVLGLLVLGVLNVLWCLFDRPWRQCWHDKAARTFVAG
ncbi:RDD family protein [Streptomyces sp. Je 1-79]|uniref:RDD family protein n=1 Tax=Streptomyces sp. Je 1-79 TaxID=2943847 RepID=UPI0021A3A467|nr:RDD family protein [Streptomyces sp. Je 1-79]MCT4356032.1 RDD family protein [Streptomyces sp. Je 1-79]